MQEAIEAYTGSFAGLELTVERTVGGWVGLVAASHCVPVRVTDELPDLGVAFVLTWREAQRIAGIQYCHAARHPDNDRTFWTGLTSRQT